MMISKCPTGFDTLYIATKTTHQKIYSVFFSVTTKNQPPHPHQLGAHFSLLYTIYGMTKTMSNKIAKQM